MAPSCASSLPEPVSSPGNSTWLLGGNPGDGEKLRGTPKSYGLENTWRPAPGELEQHNSEPHCSGSPAQELRT